MSDQSNPQHPFGRPHQGQAYGYVPGAQGAPPQGGHPGQWAPGQVFPASPAGYGLPPRPVRTGDGAWWMGLLVFAFIPFLSSVAAGITQWLVGRRQRKDGPLAAENGRRAANWGLTYLLATVVLVGSHFFLLWSLRNDGPIDAFFPFGIIITVWMAYTVVHIVVSVWGGIVAKSGRVFKMNGLPFFRP